MKNLRNIFLVTMLSLFSITVFAQTDISGKWNTGNQNTLVKIEKAGDAIIGKIVSSDNSDVRIGSTLIKDVYLKKGKWTGQMFAPRRNEWYDAEFKVKDSKLEITISVGFMSRTIEWNKVENE